MENYTLTVFESSGETLFDESFEAENDEEAKNITRDKLKEKGYEDKTHRCVSADARLVVFHR